jgi:hypothetical protein
MKKDVQSKQTDWDGLQWFPQFMGNGYTGMG